MAPKYWLKLYHEMLHDPKMQRLSDRLYRRTIELLLLAGEYGNAHEPLGILPPAEDMAWTLRSDPKELLHELGQLQEVGILTLCNGAWMVTHFADRQASQSTAERVRRFRKTEEKAIYYGTEPNENCNENVTSRSESGNENVTSRYKDCNENVTSRYTDKIREDKIREEKKGDTTAPSAFQQAVSIWEGRVGRITQRTAEQFRMAVEEYGEERLLYAVQEAHDYNKPSWRYVEAILQDKSRNKSPPALSATDLIAMRKEYAKDE